MAGRKRAYVAIDMRTTGDTPGHDSLLSLAAVRMGGSQKQFYVEIQPESNELYDLAYLKRAAEGIQCVRSNGKGVLNETFDPQSPYFDGKAFLRRMNREAEKPHDALRDFYTWILSIGSDDHLIQGVYSPAVHEGFINYYLHRFLNEVCPFDEPGLDMDSLCEGHFYIGASPFLLRRRDKKGLPSSALRGAHVIASEFESLLERQTGRRRA